MKAIKTNNNLLLLLTGLMTLFLIYLSINLHPAPDTNYYLSLARDVLDGYTPTFNVDTDYTPFAYYIIAFFLKLFGNTHAIAGLTVSWFNVSNILLVFFMLKNRLKLPLNSSIILLAVYVFTLFKLTTFYVLLEPFQVFFALISILFLTSNKLKWSHMLYAGIAMGSSIMCKQYSVLFALGVALWMFYSFLRKTYSFKQLLVHGIMFCTGVFIPYVLFVLLTPATFIGSLTQFGFIGESATSYANQEAMFFQSGAKNISKVIVLHALEFAPFILYPIYKIQKKIAAEVTRYSDLIFMVGIVSLGSILVRQYAHYFQLILPWSIMLWAAILTSYAKKPIGTNNKGLRVLTLASILLCIPGTAYMSPKLAYYFLKVDIIEKSSYRVQFTQEALSVFKEGSAVYVRGNSLLYASCNYRNPTLNYNYTSPRSMIEKGEVPEQVKKVIIPKLPEHDFLVHKQYFMEHGFRELEENKYGLYLIRMQ